MARVGGEEFAIILPNVNQISATQAAQKIRKIIEASPLKVNDQTIQITVSAGVSSALSNDENYDELIQRADKQLYLAKNSGRNCVYPIVSS